MRTAPFLSIFVAFETVFESVVAGVFATFGVILAGVCAKIFPKKNKKIQRGVKDIFFIIGKFENL